ncbi:MAG: inositol monophosphatase family protein [Acidimicrobiia bacterium]
MNPADLDHLLVVALDAAAVGSKIVRKSFGGACDIRSKGPGDWVSATDTASENAVRDALARAAPDIPFFGEEGGGIRADLGWYCDPLDGTTNFVHRFPIVGLSVALVEDGLPVVGVVDAPILGETYAGRRGGGATRNGDPLAVSTRSPAEAVCATGFPFRAKDRLDRFLPVLDRALHSLEDLRRAGAASLDLSFTASGTFDGYFELGLGPWDVAAGALLVTEAGGVVSDWDGDPRAWLASGNVVAGSPVVHRRLLELIAG